MLGDIAMLWNVIFWSGLIVSFVIGFFYFRDLGDVSQMLIKVKRKNMIRFIRNEYRLLAIGLGAPLESAVAQTLTAIAVFATLAAVLERRALSSLPALLSRASESSQP